MGNLFFMTIYPTLIYICIYRKNFFQSNDGKIFFLVYGKAICYAPVHGLMDMLTKFILIRSETNAVIFKIYRLENSFCPFRIIYFLRAFIKKKKINLRLKSISPQRKPHCKFSIRFYIILKFS